MKINQNSGLAFKAATIKYPGQIIRTRPQNSILRDLLPGNINAHAYTESASHSKHALGRMFEKMCKEVPVLRKIFNDAPSDVIIKYNGGFLEDKGRYEINILKGEKSLYRDLPIILPLNKSDAKFYGEGLAEFIETAAKS